MNMDDTNLDLERTIARVGDGKIVFGRYQLRHLLGRGGMGVVWLARDNSLEIDVALKFLPDLVASDLEAITEMKRETLRARSLRHPHIVGVFDFLQNEQFAAIGMEYVDGQTLSEFKSDKARGCFEVAEIEGWIEQLCQVLDYAHHQAR